MNAATVFTKRLLEAEDDFLQALMSGSTALERFSNGWTTLQTDLENALDSGSLDDSTINLARSISQRIASLGDNLLGLQKSSDDMGADIVTDIERVLAELSIDDMKPSSSHSASHPTKSRRSPSSPASTSNPSIPYYPAPFTWLLANFTNPYAPPSLRRSFAKDIGISPRMLDEWFKTIRRVIGWVSLCRVHFNGSRSLAAAAAQRIFSEDHGLEGLPFEMAADFHTVRSRLNNLFLSERHVDAHPEILTKVDEGATHGPHSDQSGPEALDTPFARSLSPSRAPSLTYSSSGSDEEEEVIGELPSPILFNETPIWNGKEFILSDSLVPRILSEDPSIPILPSSFLPAVIEPTALTPCDQPSPHIWATEHDLPTYPPTRFTTSTTRKRRRLDDDSSPKLKRRKERHASNSHEGNLAPKTASHREPVSPQLVKGAHASAAIPDRPYHPPIPPRSEVKRLQSLVSNPSVQSQRNAAHDAQAYLPSLNDSCAVKNDGELGRQPRTLRSAEHKTDALRQPDSTPLYAINSLSAPWPTLDAITLQSLNEILQDYTSQSCFSDDILALAPNSIEPSSATLMTTTCTALDLSPRDHYEINLLLEDFQQASPPGVDCVHVANSRDALCDFSFTFHDDLSFDAHLISP